ncbi:MAG: glycoside hydrolase family 5 protein [Tepidisphaerales bacterium]
MPPRLAPPTPPPGSPVHTHGRLKVRNHQLIGTHGRPVRLRGLSTHGLHWFGPDTFLRPHRLRELSTHWHADVLRLAVYPDEGGYLTHPARLDPVIHQLIGDTARLGLYCIVDWHILTPGNPLLRLDAARDFFERLAAMHRRHPHLLFELCNEPNGPDANWDCLREYAGKLIPAIRRYDRDRILLMGTPGWSSCGAAIPPTPPNPPANPSGPDELLRRPLAGSLAHNLLYTFHFYAASHTGHHRRVFERVASQLPVFVSEWGMNRATGHGPPDRRSTRLWLGLLDRFNTSWVYWNLSNELSACAVFKRDTPPDAPFDPRWLKPAGRQLHHLLAPTRAGQPPS